MTAPSYTEAVLFVRMLRTQLQDPACNGVELSREELEMVFMVLDSLVPEDDA